MFLKHVTQYTLCRHLLTQIISEILQYLIIMHFLLYLHFDWLLACGQYAIALNSDVTPADNSFLHVDMMLFVQIIACLSYTWPCFKSNCTSRSMVNVSFSSLKLKENIIN